MSNLEAINALITAINFDRFAEIEARHTPGATFISFRGPTRNDSISIGDWHREFLEAYADCNYRETEYIEQEEVQELESREKVKGDREIEKNVTRREAEELKAALTA